MIHLEQQLYVLPYYQQTLQDIVGVVGVVWHTGKVLACGAVSPRFKPQQGQGILQGLFCSVSGWHTTPVVRLVGLVFEHFPFTNAANQVVVCKFGLSIPYPPW